MLPKSLKAVFAIGPFLAAFGTLAQGVLGEEKLREPISPLPISIEVDTERADLGRLLFFDPSLSGDGTVSCSTCHVLEAGGDDGLVHSFGVDGSEGVINAPTVYNAALNFAQLWDGSAETLEDQVNGPILNPVEMASDWNRVLASLSKKPDLVEVFERVYPEGLTADAVRQSLAEFQRTLVTPNSPFDTYLRGQADAISQQAKDGYVLFKSYGCSSCHQGRNVGGNMYEKLGVVHNYFSGKEDITEADYGRFNQTGLEAHRFEFKVPGLRNVALTAPYFHDGSSSDLQSAVLAMAWYQLGRKLTEEETNKIVAFLFTLTGKHPELAEQ